ncbi:hypothetical protein [Methylophaga sp.]|uniref:hypothetical protein n=1 Tax=Methylophaga sp. TaxID=2024840 RepID=UPI003A953795
MQNTSASSTNIVMLRGACLWILMALLLAWCLVGLYNQLGFLQTLIPGSPKRVLQAHLDFLIMSALILGFYAAKVALPWHVRWSMVVGAFTNSSLFLMYALFPVLDPLHDTFNPDVTGAGGFTFYLYSSLLMTSYGFGKGAVIILKSTLTEKTESQ